MKLEIDINDFVKHLMFWSNKTDDECVEMAITIVTGKQIGRAHV